MTNEEKDLLIAYLVDSGELDPDGDVEAEFLEWRQCSEGAVSGEVHYKAILEPCGSGASSAGSKGCLPHRPTVRESATTALPADATPRTRRRPSRGLRETNVMTLPDLFGVSLKGCI